MSVRITIPTGLSLRDWADQISLDLDAFGAFGRLDVEENWQNWAMQFLNNTSLQENFPIPYQFTDWREWAERFCQAAE
jgi:hypothetical protein|tara:strand:- start:1010 stop:1243 length:234 start_codon:yes stop_codon:yes gene_type:complete